LRLAINKIIHDDDIPLAMNKIISVMLLFKAVKSLWGLNVIKSTGKTGLIFPNLTGVFVGLIRFALT
jgi:hypothetical protein